MKTFLFSAGLLLTLQLSAQEPKIPTKFIGAIPVLNMGTFR